MRREGVAYELQSGNVQEPNDVVHGEDWVGWVVVMLVGHQGGHLTWCEFSFARVFQPCKFILCRRRVRSFRRVMSRPSSDELQDRKRALSIAIAGARAELAKARRRERAQAKQWLLTEEMRRAVLAMYMRAGWSTEPAVRYLRARALEHHWPAKTEAELSAMVEDLMMHADPEEVDALANTSDPSHPEALRVACKYVHEWKVVDWSRRVTLEKGEAPSTRRMLQQAEADREELPERFRPGEIGTSVDRRGKRWARRLRQRWGGRVAAVPTCDRPDAAESYAKAYLYAVCSWNTRA